MDTIVPLQWEVGLVVTPTTSPVVGEVDPVFESGTTAIPTMVGTLKEGPIVTTTVFVSVLGGTTGVNSSRDRPVVSRGVRWSFPTRL